MQLDQMTFGVEIELIGLNRESAAGVIATCLSTPELRVIPTYEGAGYDKWSVTMADGRKWTAMTDASLSGGRYGHNAEVVTPILKLADMPLLQQIVRALRAAGGSVNSSCGLHVHVGAQDLQPADIIKLANLVHRREELIVAALGVQPSRLESYTQKLVESDVVKLHGHNTMRGLNTAFYGRYNPRPEHYDRIRYRGLNLHAVWNKGTVEFRYGEGCLHAGEIRSLVTYYLSLVKYAASLTRISHKKTGAVTKSEMLSHLSKLELTDPTVIAHMTKRLPGHTRTVITQNLNDAAEGGV